MKAVKVEKSAKVEEPAKVESLDDYLKKFGLHRPLLNHAKSKEPWHVEVI